MSYLAYAVAGWICVVGLYGAITSRNLIHLALCLTVTGSTERVPTALALDVHTSARTADPDKIAELSG